ncbi:zinc-dependent metalloprotease family protein [Nonlabens xiamenensis]|uniref:zinc-dependent metalloprotease family protein n=1 Tax=Nonlabens xiamenensis TaxID=2341043 RepID=UPI000F607551|nr:zinc-dependent metalloprotease family protein [Nonlabens xiamenensis]
MYKSAHGLLVLVMVLMTGSGLAQNNGKLIWKKVGGPDMGSTALFRKSEPSRANFYKMDLSDLRAQLQQVTEASIPGAVPTSIVLPTSHGLEVFEVFETPTMADALQNKYPNIRTYTGAAAGGTGNSIKFTVDPYGFHGMVFSPEHGTSFIDPYTTDRGTYIAYAKADLPAIQTGSHCEVVEEDMPNHRMGPSSYHAKNANDGLLRRFRIAISATVEYSEFHWTRAGLSATDTEAQKRTAVLAAMNVTLARNNFIYERDLSLTMELVANNDLVVFINSDNLDNNNANNVLFSQNPQVLDANIGFNNYDIGHVFTTGGGGIASLASPCTNRKAQGVTGLPAPIGDPFDVDFVAHEIGHQFGALHSFNGSTANCSGGNRSASAAYEPGSGSTIMGYAGICPPQNVQQSTDPYFHQISLENIFDNIRPGGFSTCSQNVASLNVAPVAIAGSDRVIPISTPYRLVGASTDVDGTVGHTYTWEQFDLGPSGIPTETSASGPLVRSFEGSDDPIRYIPRLPDIVLNGGNSTTWEKLASISRPMTFALTVRDNDSRGGQTAVDFVNIITTDNAGPFVVTSQNTTGITWLPNTTETITWDVAGTNANGVNENSVDILLSTDAGETFDTILASNVPNNGSATITVPGGIVAPFCRLMVVGATNPFFNINSTDFSVNAQVTETCTTYSSGNISIPIADGTGSGTTPVAGPVTANVINIPDNDSITGISINVDISHSFIQDLIFEVTDPSSTTVRLWQFNCGNNDDLDVNFEEGAPNIVCASPTVGTYQPLGNLNDFVGNDSGGNWTLAIADFFSGDNGTLNDWAVEICTTTVTPLSNEEFAADRFSIYPNPNRGAFEINFGEARTGKTNIQVFDLNGRSVYQTIYDFTNGLRKKIELSNVTSGVYLVRIENEGRVNTQKILVE